MTEADKHKPSGEYEKQLDHIVSRFYMKIVKLF